MSAEIIRQTVVKKMGEFKLFHPAAEMLYFAAAIIFSCIFMHPVMLCEAVLCSLVCLAVLKGAGKVGKALAVGLPSFAAAALINPAFNHRGVTVLAYLPSGNPLTVESVYYGLAFAAMLVSVMIFFACFNSVMTSDKITYLFGRAWPALALIFSMTVHFVPEFIKKMKSMAEAQASLGKKSGRLKNAVEVFFATVSKSMEDAVDTSDSMTARGYGLPKRTAFSIYRITARDFMAFLYIIALSAYIIYGAAVGAVSFSYFPKMSGIAPTAFGVSVFVAYALLLALPAVIELYEVIKWKFLK